MQTMDRTIPPVVSARELRELLDEGADLRLLDVRTPGEYEAVHIRGAYNVPLDTLGEHGGEIRAHVETPVVLVCQSGSRARKAEEALARAGMPNLHVLDGGVNGWAAAGKPVRRGAERMSLERQVRIAAGTLAATGGILALAVNPLFGLLAAFVGKRAGVRGRHRHLRDGDGAVAPALQPPRHLRRGRHGARAQERRRPGGDEPRRRSPKRRRRAPAPPEGADDADPGDRAGARWSGCRWGCWAAAARSSPSPSSCTCWASAPRRPSP